jgi:hypothetical protein
MPYAFPTPYLNHSNEFDSSSFHNSGVNIASYNGATMMMTNNNYDPNSMGVEGAADNGEYYNTLEVDSQNYVNNNSKHDRDRDGGRSRLCEYPDCGKCAQGGTKYCIKHGGKKYRLLTLELRLLIGVTIKI